MAQRLNRLDSMSSTAEDDRWDEEDPSTQQDMAEFKVWLDALEAEKPPQPPPPHPASVRISGDGSGGPTKQATPEPKVSESVPLPSGDASGTSDGSMAAPSNPSSCSKCGQPGYCNLFYMLISTFLLPTMPDSDHSLLMFFGASPTGMEYHLIPKRLSSLGHLRHTQAFTLNQNLSPTVPP